MKIVRSVVMCGLLAAPLAAMAQQAPAPPPDAPPEAQGQMRRRGSGGSVWVERTPAPDVHTRMQIETNAMMKMRQPLGKWWKNSEIVEKVGVTPQQVNQLEKIFLDHRLKLIDLRADLERQETQLEPLIEAEQPDENKVGAQIDAIAAARGRLEKANTLMMLAIRKTLSVEQWKKLQEMHPPMMMTPFGHVEVFREGDGREMRFKVEPRAAPVTRPRTPPPTIEELF